MESGITIRRAAADDVAAITEIYNDAVRTTTGTFDTEPKTRADRMEWFEDHDARHPVFVAVANGRVIGWSSLSEWSDRNAYADAVETSIYVREEARGRGVGRQLLAALLAAAREGRFHTVLARIAGENTASLRLHANAGFATAGTLREVGRKFGRLLDVQIMQLMLE